MWLIFFLILFFFHRANVLSADVVCFISFLSFLDCAFDIISKNSLLNPRSQKFSPMFSSVSCIVSCFAFWSVIHFEVLFNVASICSFLCISVSSCSCAISQKDRPVCVELTLRVCQWSVGPTCMGLFLHLILAESPRSNAGPFLDSLPSHTLRVCQ